MAWNGASRHVCFLAGPVDGLDRADAICVLDLTIGRVEQLSDILIGLRVREHHWVLYLNRGLADVTAHLHAVLAAEHVGVLGAARRLYLISRSFLVVALLVLTYLGRLPLLLPGLKEVNRFVLVKDRNRRFKVTLRQLGCAQIGSVHVEGYLANFFHELRARQGNLGRKVPLVGVRALGLVLGVLRIVIAATPRVGRYSDAI